MTFVILNAAHDLAFQPIAKADVRNLRIAHRTLYVLIIQKTLTLKLIC